MRIHPDHLPELRRALRVCGLMLLILIAVLLVPWPQSSAHISYYLSLHLATETFSIVVSSLVFAVVWSLREEEQRRNLALLGVMFLGVALLDFSHMLSGQGMPDYITASSSDKAIYFWLAARAFTAVALLAVAWLPWSARSNNRQLLWGGLLMLLVVAALHPVYFQHLPFMPSFFVPGSGLTTPKIVIEYLIAAVFVVAALRFWLLMRAPREFHVAGLFATCVLMALSEFFFTLYLEVTDVYILTGHIFKVLACLYLFHAVFVESVRVPYQKLRESRQRLQATLGAVPDLLIEIDQNGRYLQVHSINTDGIVGSAAELIGKTVDQALPARAAQTIHEAIATTNTRGFSRGSLIELPIGSQTRWFEISASRLLQSAGKTATYLFVSRDVTERVENNAIMRTLRLAVMQSPLAFVVTDHEHRIQLYNDAYARISGGLTKNLLGQRPVDLEASCTSQPQWRNMEQTLSSGHVWKGELTRTSSSGAEIILSALIIPVRDEAGNISNYLAHLEDITEKRRSQQRIQELSQYDQLTGLPNRALLQEHFSFAQRQTSRFAVLWIDLDHFKDINDTLGHQAGDSLLLEISYRLRAALGTNDILSRLSGDDFLAVLPGTDQESAAAQAQNLLCVLAAPLQLEGQELSISASIGIAQCPDDAQELDTLLRHAETAMYRAKSDGRNTICFFTAQMQEQTSRLLALGNALRFAIQRAELYLVYQPQLRLRDERILGAEALLRWESPQWGSISPAEFIPIAESTGLILDIGDWVIKSAIGQIRSWLDSGLDPDLVISVNLSAQQFNQTDLPDRITEMLATAGVAAHNLGLELTEAVAMKSPEFVAQQIQELSARGLRIAIDDFGTGYSSLSYLKRFKIHKLKIDQSFVRDLSIDPDDQAIATAIIQMSHSLGISTIAEGVETKDQLQFLRARGCEQIQGYYFSRPLAPADFVQFLRQHQPGA